MNPVKVKITEQHKEHLVCKGKLILIKCKPEEGLLSYHTVTGYELYDYNKDGLIRGHFDYIKPIIISETEEIESGDIIAHHEYGIGKVISPKATGKYWICQFNGKEETDTVIGVFKILALSESFSPIQLESIVDGILKDGDEVFLICEWLGNDVGVDYANELYHYVKLTNNFINIIKPRNQELDLDKISKLIDEALDKETTESLTKWLLDKRNKDTQGCTDVMEFYQEKDDSESWDDIKTKYNDYERVFTITQPPNIPVKTELEWLEDNYNPPKRK